MNEISLYFHFPFCTRKCNYCAFYSVPWATEADKDQYLSALKKQCLSFPESRPVYSVYFGGGTPNIFGAERLCNLLDFIRSHFSLTEDCEITIEVNPCSVTAEDFRALKRHGFNRISVGMQSSDDSILKKIGRQHTFEQTIRCMENARLAGFTNISLDLLFALPDQTTGMFQQSVRDAISLNPDHISAYSLQIEEGTPFFIRRNELNLPSEDEEENQYKLLCDELSKAGFRHYEISSFAKPQKESRHNLHYWKRGEYLGFGPAAHSHWNGKRFSNINDLKAYLQDPLRANDYKETERISPEEILEEEIMLGLRTDEGIPLSLVQSNVVETLLPLGLVSVSGNRIRITESGWRVSNAIIGRLLP